ncbi:MAG: hypothetical protein LBU45_04315 [Azoarcus sp.]|jgi:hypothetical protein|nr:hypothetical protein [Azoarcus sp.]
MTHRRGFTMIFPRRTFCLRTLALLAALPLLSACENNNSATAMTIDSKDHALVLVREQPLTFWKDEVTQYIVVSRLPDCQRRVKIHPGKTGMSPIAVYEAGNLLWALFQGGQWYLASTGSCKVQDWHNPAGQPPGAAVGSFEQKNGEIVFIPVPAAQPVK